MITHTYRNLSQDEKIMLYIRLLESINKRTDKDNEKTNGNIHKAECGQKGKFEYRRSD